MAEKQSSFGFAHQLELDASADPLVGTRETFPYNLRGRAGDYLHVNVGLAKPEDYDLSDVCTAFRLTRPPFRQTVDRSEGLHRRL